MKFAVRHSNEKPKRSISPLTILTVVAVVSWSTATSVHDEISGACAAILTWAAVAWLSDCNRIQVQNMVLFLSWFVYLFCFLHFFLAPFDICRRARFVLYTDPGAPPTVFTVDTKCSRGTRASEFVDGIQASSTIEARIACTLIDIWRGRLLLPEGVRSEVWLKGNVDRWPLAETCRTYQSRNGSLGNQARTYKWRRQSLLYTVLHSDKGCCRIRNLQLRNRIGKPTR